MSAPYTELDKPLDEYAVLCRGCLADSGEMKNAFDWGLAEDFHKFTDIRLSSSDTISSLLCTACEEMLVSCQRFRTQCQHSNYVLLNTTKETSPNLTSSNQYEANTITTILKNKLLVIKIIAPDMDSKIYLPCPHCTQKYIKQSDLLLHLSRNHEVNRNDFEIQLQYYCSIPKCSYESDSGTNKYFQCRKYLNQHHIKVHKHKIFHCDSCTLSFATNTEFNRHLKTCNVTYLCEICDVKYKSNEKLLVHLMRKHPDLHQKYKEQRKALKRKSLNETKTKKSKADDKLDWTAIDDSPKRSFATQTLKLDDNIRNDVSLSWLPSKSDNYAKTDEISTQTVFEDLLSLKSQPCEDESLFFSETVSLSDIQTQTFPLEFGLSRSDKETITSETQSPDLSIKETQTCFCLYDSPKLNFRLFDSISSSPSNSNLTSTETQTSELRSTVKSDVLLSCNSAETQTSFEDGLGKDSL